MNTNVLTPEFLSAAGASEVTGVGSVTLYRLIRSGKIKVKEGSRTLIETKSLAAWIETLPVATFSHPSAREAEAKLTPVEKWELNRELRAAASRWAGRRI
jgi:hypothetical protein